MTIETPLRRLAREYFEGRIGREYYVEQRQRLIESLVDGRAQGDFSQNTTHPELFQSQNEDKPDSTELVNAFARRSDDCSATADADPGGPAPDLDVTTAPTLRIETEAAPEQSESEHSRHEDQRDESPALTSLEEPSVEAHESSSRTQKLFLVLLLLILWLLWSDYPIDILN